MPAIEEVDRLQKAVVWPKEGNDRYGQPSIGDPSEIDVRWNTKRRQAYDANGNLVTLDGTAVVLGIPTDNPKVFNDIPVGSVMWLGELLDWYAVGSGGPDTTLGVEVMEVITYNSTPDIRNREERRVVGLRKYKGKLPSVIPPISLSPASLPSWSFTGGEYSHILVASGGTGIYTYELTDGALPDGFDLDASGIISGTPAASGTFSFTITVTDSAGNTLDKDYSIAITSILLSDTFTGANGANLVTHTMNVGSGWTLQSGTTWDIQSNSARKITVSQADNIIWSDAGASDVTISCTIKDSLQTSNVISGLCGRVVDENNHWLLIGARSTGPVGFITTLRLYSVVAGVYTLLDEKPTSSSPPHSISLVFDGTTITGTCGTGTPVQAISSVHQSATKHGIYASYGQTDNPGITFDDFLVTG